MLNVVKSNFVKLRNRLSTWLVALLHFSVLSYGMAQSPEALKRKALSTDTDPGERKALLQAAWEMDTTNFEYRYELAMSCIALGFHWEAIQHLKYIYSKEEGKIYSDNLYHQAKLYQRLGRSEEAQGLYEKYLRRHATKGCLECVKMSRQELDRIKRIQKSENTKHSIPLPFEAKLDSIGSPKFLATRGEHTQNILIGSSDNSLIYRECKEDCAISRIPFSLLQQSSATTTEEPLLLNNGINAFYQKDNIVCSLTAEGVFSFTDSTGSEIKTIPRFSHNLLGYRETFPTLNATHDRLYFSSDRPGGYGGMDVWVSLREGDTWLAPQNCGKKCNTKGDEVFPVVFAEQLYFSSDGHDGLGGLDVFMWQPEREKLIHLDEPIASSADEIALQFITLQDGKKYAAWSSNRPIHANADACCFYIWYAPLMVHADSAERPIQVENSSAISEHLYRKPLKLYFHNDEPDPRSKVCQTKLNYASCWNNYLARMSEYYQSTESSNNRDLLNAFFEIQLSSSILRMDSLLEEIQKILKEGENGALFVRGFASARASSEYNQCLSERRISSFQKSLETWRDGTLLPYTNGTQTNRLVLITRPLGEDTTHATTGEEIYSYRACLSRRIDVEQFLSGTTEILAPLNVQLKPEESQVSFILVNVADEPFQPIITSLPENLSLEGVREIPPRQEITVTLRRMETQGNNSSGNYKIRIQPLENKKLGILVSKEPE